MAGLSSVLVLVLGGAKSLFRSTLDVGFGRWVDGEGAGGGSCSGT